MLQMFLEDEQEKAEQELDCYGYCMSQAIESKLKGEFHRAAMWHENMRRSLNELEIMKQNKIKIEAIEQHKMKGAIKTYEKN